MLKWAMRIVAVGGALLAMAVIGAAWLHWDGDRDFGFAAPRVVGYVKVYPSSCYAEIFLRHQLPPLEELRVGKYGLISEYEDRSGFNCLFRARCLLKIDDEAEWSGFGYWRGRMPGAAAPCFTGVYCPTRYLIAVLLLPTGLRAMLGWWRLWAGIAWRQRRRAMAGRCVGCGYDLRASPERCPECGRAVKQNAEVRMRNAER